MSGGGGKATSIIHLDTFPGLCPDLFGLCPDLFGRPDLSGRPDLFGRPDDLDFVQINLDFVQMIWTLSRLIWTLSNCTIWTSRFIWTLYNLDVQILLDFVVQFGLSKFGLWTLDFVLCTLDFGLVQFGLCRV